MSTRVFSGLIGLSSLLTVGHALADAKQCVAQNNDGAQKRDEHHLIAARDAYRACVAERECPEIIRSECDNALNDLKTAIPTLLVAVLDDQQHDIAGATLTLDGNPIALDGSTIEVDPGAHQLIAKSGDLTSELQVVAIESDLNRRVELVLHSPHVDQPSPAPVTDVPPAPPRSKAPAYILGGVGVAGLASFGIFAASGYSKKTGTLDNCKPYCATSDVKAVRTDYLIADISLAVSLVSLVGAGYWLLTSPKETQHATKPRPFSVGVAAAPGLAAVSLRWVE